MTNRQGYNNFNHSRSGNHSWSVHIGLPWIWIFVFFFFWWSKQNSGSMAVDKQTQTHNMFISHLRLYLKSVNTSYLILLYFSTCFRPFWLVPVTMGDWNKQRWLSSSPMKTRGCKHKQSTESVNVRKSLPDASVRWLSAKTWSCGVDPEACNSVFPSNCDCD